MSLVELQRKLIAAARAHPPSDRVPLAFEKRISALLRTRPKVDQWALWARALWRSAAACAGLALLLGAFCLFAPKSSAPTASGNLSQAFESTMLAAADQNSDASW